MRFVKNECVPVDFAKSIFQSSHHIPKLRCRAVDLLLQRLVFACKRLLQLAMKVFHRNPSCLPVHVVHESTDLKMLPVFLFQGQSTVPGLARSRRSSPLLLPLPRCRASSVSRRRDTRGESAVAAAVHVSRFAESSIRPYRSSARRVELHQTSSTRIR